MYDNTWTTRKEHSMAAKRPRTGRPRIEYIRLQAYQKKKKKKKKKKSTPFMQRGGETVCPSHRCAEGKVTILAG